MQINSPLKKGFALIVIVLFIEAGVVPSISGNNGINSVINAADNIPNTVSRTPIYNGSLSGYVNDTSMNPIAGLRVRVYFHGTYEENYSDSSGYYHVTNIPICYCLKNVTAFKEGYKTEWILLSITENTTYDFVVMPLSCYPALDGTMGENGWYVSDVIITFKGSGCGSVYYKIDDGGWVTYTAPIVISEDGIHLFCWYYIDSEGHQSVVECIEIKIDQTPPTTKVEFDGIIEDEGWFVSNVTVTLSAEDETSGVDYILYKIDDGEWTTYTYPFVVTEDGEHTLYYYSVDLAGNTEMTKEVDFKIDYDIVPPVTTHEFEGVMGDNDWFTSNVVVTLTAEDDSSGVDYTMYKLDDGEWTEYMGPFLVREDGEHELRYYSVDKVGNKEDVKGPFGFKIDKTAPTIELTWDEENSKLIAEVYDETSGVAKVEFYVNGEYVGEATEPPYEWTVPNPKPGDRGQAIVYDKAGNEAISCPPPPPPPGTIVFGIIRNPEFTEETVSFFAIVVISDRSPFCMFWQQLTFQNDYSGYIGEHFIFAVFEYGPV